MECVLGCEVHCRLRPKLCCKRARTTSVWLEAEHPSGEGGPIKKASSNFSRDISLPAAQLEVRFPFDIVYYILYILPCDILYYYVIYILYTTVLYCILYIAYTTMRYSLLLCYIHIIYSTVLYCVLYIVYTTMRYSLLLCYIHII